MVRIANFGTQLEIETLAASFHPFDQFAGVGRAWCDATRLVLPPSRRSDCSLSSTFFRKTRANSLLRLPPLRSPPLQLDADSQEISEQQERGSACSPSRKAIKTRNKSNSVKGALATQEGAPGEREDHGGMRITLSDRDPQHKVVWFKGIESLLAGAGAGLVSSIVTCPLDVVKTKLQAAGPNGGGITGQSPFFLARNFHPLFPSTNSFRLFVNSTNDDAYASTRSNAGTFKRIWQNDGFRGLYRGLGPTIVGYLPTWAIYFTVYDKVKESMGVFRGAFLVSPSARFSAFFFHDAMPSLVNFSVSLSKARIAESEGGRSAARTEQSQMGKDDKKYP